MPGVIESFDASKQTATVRPALRMRVNLGPDEQREVDLPLITGVPVVFPYAQNAGYMITFPLQPGDECLLVFADRPIDNFVAAGGVQSAMVDAGDTCSPRGHALSDAMCIPGLVSGKHAISDFSTTSLELRDRDRSSFIRLGPDGIEIKSSGPVTISGANGTLADAGGISLGAHRHTGVQPGTGTTGGPV